VSRKAHWEGVYRQKAPETVSWYQPRAAVSMRLIERAGVGAGDRIIDVGGGASVLVENLLEAGHPELTVLDLSRAALARTRSRLGGRAAAVTWLEADVTAADLPAAGYDLWHDRAVFHFLVEPGDREAYLRTLRQALRPGGHAIIATFAEDGPERCSGLPVRRYSAQQLHRQLGEGFELLAHEREDHVTPGGAVQRFQYGLFRGPRA
jgi:ubiquinone/menaquinone biosynthesis C-methylase UbiE